MAGSVDQAVEAVYEAAGRRDGWLPALAAVHECFRAQAGAFYVQDPHQTDGFMNGAETAVTRGYDARLLRDYMAHYYALNPFVAHVGRMGVGNVASETDLPRFAPDRRFHDSEFYVDWCRPQGFRHVLGQYLQNRNDGLLIMALWRPASEGPFGAAEYAAFDGLNRHVLRSLDIGARLRTAEAEMEAMLGRSFSAVFTLGRDGRVRQCNAVADALVRSGCGLVVSGGALRTAAPDQQAALDRLIACAFDPRRVAWAENARVLVRRTDGAPALAARVAAVAHRFDPFGPDRTASVILTVEGFEMETALLTERLRRRFGLSAAQARLALALRSGRTLKEAAAELDVSYETVRTHLKAIFERTGTRRQAELVILLGRETRD